MITKRHNSGMSLIEVIISLAILGIVFVSVLTVFSTSFIWVNSAGNKGKAYNKTQIDIESRIGTGEAIYSEDLRIVINGKSYNIRGGLLESTQYEGKTSSEIDMFLPYVPTIRINPMVQFEGAISTTVNITGYNTHFNSSTIVELYDSTGVNKLYTTVPIVKNNEQASFSIPLNLLNSDYIIRVKTALPSSDNEVVRAKYTVEQPKFVAVGNKLYVSADGINWTDRAAIGSLPAFSELNAIINKGDRYIAVGDNGTILLSNEKAPWSSVKVSSENLMGVVWSSQLDKYYAVGANGNIYSSSNALTWKKTTTSITTSLNDIVSVPFSYYNPLIAVGNNGVILNSFYGYWIKVFHEYGYTNLNAVASDNGKVDPIYGVIDPVVVAVGDNGTVLYSKNGWDWRKADILPKSNINDITYNNELSLFIAVGDNGLILTSSNGINWQNVSKSEHKNYNFQGVFSDFNEVIVVGEKGIILYSDNGGNTWEVYQLSTDELVSVAGK